MKTKNTKLFKSINSKLSYSYFNQPQNFDPKKNYYDILRLNKDASDSDIKKAYYKLAKEYHPDVNKGYQTKFKQISEAYQVLSNQKTRQQYDSARIFSQRWSQMGSKASSGNYSYEEYQNIFAGMSPEQRQKFTAQAQARARRYLMYLGGFLIFWIFFSRTPHKAYTQYNGTLIPIIGGPGTFQYPEAMAQNSVYNPNPNAIPISSPYTPYGQPINQYQNQSYVNQYPQTQYAQNTLHPQSYPSNYSNNNYIDPLMQIYPAQPRQGSFQ